MKTKTYQIKRIDPDFWHRVRVMALLKKTNIREFIMNYLKKEVDKFENET